MNHLNSREERKSLFSSEKLIEEWSGPTPVEEIDPYTKLFIDTLLFLPCQTWQSFEATPIKRLKDGLTYISHKNEEEEATSHLEVVVYKVLNRIFKDSD